MSVAIPLLPLGAVLFPHMPLSLHIFEERYREMMRDCEAEGHGFGIVAIREGREVGGGARPYLVGTLAQLRDVDRLPDGRYDLVVGGASRFRITELNFERTYLTAEVEYLEELPGAVDAELVARARHVHLRYCTALADMLGAVPADEQLPSDPEQLSYAIAGTLQVETGLKQDLLETDTASIRLQRSIRMMRRELIFLEQRLARRDPRFATSSAN